MKAPETAILIATQKNSNCYSYKYGKKIAEL